MLNKQETYNKIKYIYKTLNIQLLVKKKYMTKFWQFNISKSYSYLCTEKNKIKNLDKCYKLKKNV